MLTWDTILGLQSIANKIIDVRQEESGEFFKIK